MEVGALVNLKCLGVGLRNPIQSYTANIVQDKGKALVTAPNPT